MSANDPYVLGKDWLDIQVKEQGSVFVVETRARSRSAAEEALERAVRFRGTHQGPEPLAPTPRETRAATAEISLKSTSATQ
jgi:hypothetical protein